MLFDHKTTSEDLDPFSPLWRRFDIDPQKSYYEILTRSNSVPIDNVIWDVSRKPSIRPKKTVIGKSYTNYPGSEEDYLKAVFGTFAEIDFAGTYCGLNISYDETVDEPGEIETPEMFARRVAHVTCEDKDRYYRRRLVNRSDDELMNLMDEVWHTCKTIRQHENGKAKPYRNHTACMQWGRPCEYLEICSGTDDKNGGNYLNREKIHAELNVLPTEPLKVMTNSRLGCFKSCQMKHNLRYIEGIEKKRDEDVEALYFGTLWHEALDAYFGAFDTSEVTNGA